MLVPIEQWRRLEKMARPNLKELLLTPEARTKALTPPRAKHRHRRSAGTASITAARPEIERQQQRVTKLGEESLAIRPDCSIMDIRWTQESSGSHHRS